MQVNGITVKFGGDQAKLMESLSKSITGSPKGVYSGKGQPKDDLLKSGKDFATVIPTGFLVLHKDLQELIKGGGAQKASLGSMAQIFGTIFAAVGAVAIAGTIVKGLFSGNSDAGEAKLQSLIDELMNGMDAGTLQGDPEVQAALKQGITTYIKSYFIAQSASAIITEAIGGIGSGAAAAVENLVGGLLGKETKDDAQQHLKDIIDGIILAQNPEDWKPGGKYWDSGEEDTESSLEKEVRIGIMAYLGVWFAAQAASMAVETVVGGVGTAIGEAINNLFSSLFGKNTDDEAVTHLKSIVEAIIKSQDPATWAAEAVTSGTDLNTEVRVGIMAYLGVWFAAQATAMAVKTVVEGAGSAIGGAINNLFTSLFGKNTDDDSVTHLKEIIDKIISGQNADVWVTEATTAGSDLYKAVRGGLAAYIAVWFGAQAASMAIETVAEGAGTAIGSFFNGIFGGLFGKKRDDDPMEGKIQAIIDKVINGVNPNDSGIAGSDEVKKAVTEGIAAYVQSYFETVAYSATSGKKAAAKGEAVVEGVKAAASKVWSWLTGKDKKETTTSTDPMDVLGQKLTQVITIVVNKLDPNSLSSDTYMSMAIEGTQSFVQSYFAAFGELTDDKQNLNSVGLTVINDTTLSSAVLGLYRNIFTGLLEGENVESLKSQVRTAQRTSILDTATKIFEIESKAIKNNYNSTLSNKQIDTALAGISDAYLNAVKESLNSGFNLSSSLHVTAQTDTRVLTALTRIQEQLDQLNGNAGDIKENQGVMAGLYAAGVAGSDSGGEVDVTPTLAGKER